MQNESVTKVDNQTPVLNEETVLNYMLAVDRLRIAVQNRNEQHDQQMEAIQEALRLLERAHDKAQNAYDKSLEAFEVSNQNRASIDDLKARLSRLPCWKDTDPIPCPLVALDEVKTGG